MNYNVEVDFAPIYECVSSLTAFMNKQNHHALEAGKLWVREVQDLFAPAKIQEMREIVKATDDFSLAPFIWTCPGERTVHGFLDWLENLSTGQLYDIAAGLKVSVPSNLPELRTQTVEALREWDATYFQHIDPAIIEGLAQEAKNRRTHLTGTDHREVYEQATEGMRLYPNSQLKKVILIPQYHARPFVTSAIFDEVIFTYYSCDILPPEPGRPAHGLMRLTWALSDETRLYILRLLAGKQLTFSEIVREVKLSKSTIHYHLIALRAAGLVIVHVNQKSTAYTLRMEALDKLSGQIATYIED
ncbi:helix-turn-helix transcriptional regulator [Paenibacillus illinoisensis]|uniref:ArsR/SmtB family transcription factor n=1 Tax=Paenibacillus illinoisensis TaxID=59845 RepID=UPI001C8D61FF|nr:winged helix-turn-helix domain-containing protein [Paenibacillus illinoisensis]MBY0217881.1 winged helix-turn-helix transcriptional regulator [Paenibacillus illinoisensis]